MSDTKVTTTIIMAVRLSTRKPTSILRSPTTIHVYRVSLKWAPSSATLLSVIADRIKATNTPRMVKVWLSRRPIQLPPKDVPRIPASRAPASGAMGTASRVEAESVALIVVISF